MDTHDKKTILVSRPIAMPLKSSAEAAEELERQDSPEIAVLAY
jgi:hypothetical protein